MCQSKHTPGPLEFADMRVYGKDGLLLATLEDACGGAAENEANGRLFASAPDLLAALEDTANRLEMAASDAGGRRDFSDRDGYMAVALRARAAIAKAKGGPLCSTA